MKRRSWLKSMLGIGGLLPFAVLSRQETPVPTPEAATVTLTSTMPLLPPKGNMGILRVNVVGHRYKVITYDDFQEFKDGGWHRACKIWDWGTQFTSGWIPGFPLNSTPHPWTVIPINEATRVEIKVEHFEDQAITLIPEWDEKKGSFKPILYVSLFAMGIVSPEVKSLKL